MNTTLTCSFLLRDSSTFGIFFFDTLGVASPSVSSFSSTSSSSGVMTGSSSTSQLSAGSFSIKVHVDNKLSYQFVYIQYTYISYSI